jgi:hypothetical protein
MNALAAADLQDEYGDATESDLITTIKERAKANREARSAWIDEAKIAYEFVSGHQWTAEELEALRSQRRPPVVFNRIEPVINVVAGLEVTNRQEVRYLPRELGDAGPNEVLTGAAQWVRDECNAEDEESEAFLDMAICGEGWTETRLDYEYDADGMILTGRVDPLEMLPDAGSTRKNYKDAENLIREKMVTPLWVKETWPEKAEDIDAAVALREDSSSEFDGEGHRNIIGDQYRSPGALSADRQTKKLIKLTEYQYKKREPFHRIKDPSTGQVIELEPAEFQAIEQRAQAMGVKIQSVKQLRCKHYRAFAVGDVLLENKPCPDPDSFTYHAMTAKRDRKKGCWYGIVRGMLDPQRWANKFFSQSMFILNTNAKGGVMYEKDAVDDVEKFETSWAHPDKPTQVSSGALTAGKIQPKVPPPFPPELAQLMQFTIASIYQVSGVSPEMLGTVDRDQPASLEYQRKQAGVTILATLFDALRKYRKEQGRNLLYLIQTYISDGRLIRIVGREGAKYVPLIRAEGSGKYDVIIDESPSSPNMKEKTWAILQGLLPVLLKAGIPIPPETLDYLPLPQSFIDSMKKPDPSRQQEQMEQKQLAVAEKVAEIKKTNAEADKAKAEAQTKMVEAGLRRAEIEGQAAEMQNKLAVETIATQKKVDLERWKAEQDAALEVWKAQQKAALERDLAAMNADLAHQKAKAEVGIKAETVKAEVEMQKDKLRGEQDVKGITDVRKFTDVSKGLKEKIEFLQNQLSEVKAQASRSAPRRHRIIRDKAGKAQGIEEVV